MRKQLVFLSSLLVLVGMGGPLPAIAAKVVPVSTGIHIVGAEADSQDVSTLLSVVQDLISSSNSHSLEGVLKHYSPRFMSGDNLTLDQVQHLIEDTWRVYPDIQYDTKTLEIRVNGDWATIESMDTAKAVAKADDAISETPGVLESSSRGLLFLKRVGKSWEIMSDYTLYESSTILYGEAKNLKITLSTPDQVFAGESYTAKIDVQVPKGAFAFASIVKDPLVYPQKAPDDKFRSLSDEQDSLERVFKANSTNNNEIVTATLGFTQVGQDDEERPTIKLNGVATIVKRVNVLPISKYIPEGNEHALVRQSASGLIDLSKTVPSSGHSEDPSLSKIPPAPPSEPTHDQGGKPETPPAKDGD